MALIGVEVDERIVASAAEHMYWKSSGRCLPVIILSTRTKVIAPQLRISNPQRQRAPARHFSTTSLMSMRSCALDRPSPGVAWDGLDIARLRERDLTRAIGVLA